MEKPASPRHLQVVLVLLLPSCAIDYAEVGLQPLVGVGRTEIDADLRQTGAGGVEVARVVEDHGLFYTIFGYTPLEDERTGDEFGLFRLDFAGGELAGGAVFLGGVPYWMVGAGAMYLDHDDGDGDMAGVGVFVRVGLVFNDEWGTGEAGPMIQTYADVHGWLGGDEAGFRAAGAWTLGVSVAVGF